MKSNTYMKSFVHAVSGLLVAFKSEKHVRFHCFSAVLVVALGCYFQITSAEWISITLTIGLIISLELLNTAIEKLADFCSLEHQDLIKKSKDIAAGAVLISSICALIVGAIIFVPYLLK